MERGHVGPTPSRRIAQSTDPTTTHQPDVAGRIQGVWLIFLQDRAEEIDALLGRHEPDKERANVPPPKPRRPKPAHSR